MLVDKTRGQVPPFAFPIAVARHGSGLVLISERARISVRRPSYQAMLGRKNPLSSKGTAA